ncbi:MAG: FAD-binding oxidoreductase [Rhodospirillaceae bacterium]
MSIDQAILDRLVAIVGQKACLTEASDIAPYLEEERGLYHGATSVVVRPGSTDEVAAVVTLCAEEGIGIVPQGGNTGLCGGGIPAENGSEIILALGRMNAVRGIDPTNFTMTVDAGCILTDIQNKADEQDCLFPLSLGAEGSCQIGGNLATNAGGINVLRYGNARDLVLGLEVVLPDGRVWNGLRALGKDNTGYALKQLFVGSEGSLGVITAAVLKLFPKPRETETAFCALNSLDDVTRLLNRARALSGDAVTAFELVPRIGLEFCTRHIDGVTDPLSEAYDWYTLIEFSTSRPNSDLRAGFEGLLEAAFEDGIIVDAVIAESQAQAENLWRIRESLPEAQKHEGGSIKHDVSVPVSLVPEFVTRGTAAVLKAYPGARPCPFGHVGDGNVHFNVSQPEDMDKDAYLSEWEAMNRIVHDLVMDMNGSISAEHGIGRLKVEEMEYYKDAVELDLMKTLKAALDPKCTMNPGKVVH